MADEKKAVVEEVKNCPACKKPLKKARRFYRNGAYFCNNNCYKTVAAKVLAEKQKAAAEAKASAEAAAVPAESPKE